MRTVDLIQRKRDGEELSQPEIAFLVEGYTSGEIPDYQKRLKVAHVPVVLHMSLVLVLGLYMPKFLADWFHAAVGLLK